MGYTTLKNPDGFFHGFTVEDGYLVKSDTGNPVLICTQCGILVIGNEGEKCGECKSGKFQKARA
jgi:hypothetical protein